MMRVANFTYVLKHEGWYWAIKVGVSAWIMEPWETVRYKLAKLILWLLGVTKLFDG